MAIRIPDGVKKVARSAGASLVGQAIPYAAAGYLGEELRNISVKDASQWVQDDVSLLSNVTPEHLHQLSRLTNLCDDYSWMTTEWAIKAIKETNPALASLYLGWPEGRAWLERQLEEIKKELKG